MPRPSDTASNIEASVTPEQVGPLVKKLRTSFNTDKTRSLAWRAAQLRALDRMLKECREELAQAAYEDVHKDPFQVFIQEMGLIHQEIYDALKHLEEWSADESVGTGLFNAPALSYIQKDPLGVCLILGAWNYNILLSIHPMVGAIAAGNCVIVKPGSYAAQTSHVICKAINKYMDPECIVAVEGNRDVTNRILEEKLDMIFFTGSPFVGKVIAQAAAKNLTPVVLELGGKSPCIIDRTANIPVAAKRYAWGAFLNASQTCVRPDYVMVHEHVAEEFIHQVKKSLVEFYGTDARRSEWYGRLINQNAFERLRKCLEKDAKYLIHGGSFDASEKYIEPTLFDFGNDITAFEQSELMSDEIFGPLVPIFRYNDLDTQVLPFIRSREKPLGIYCFTADKEVSEHVLRLTSSGGAIINDVVIHLVNPELPFGGVGASGMGSYHGKYSFDCFSHKKAVIHRTTLIDPPMRYPPFSVVDQAVINAAFFPALNYYASKATHALTDSKNMVIAAMGLYILRNASKTSKL